MWIQSAHARALDIVAHSGHFPWGKDTDVARWCIQFGLQYINSIDDELHGMTSIMKQANIIDAINKQTARNVQFMANFDQTQQNVMQLKGMGEPEMAQELVMRIWSEIKQMPDEPEHEARWKKKYMDRFETMFKDMLVY